MWWLVTHFHDINSPDNFIRDISATAWTWDFYYVVIWNRGIFYGTEVNNLNKCNNWSFNSKHLKVCFRRKSISMSGFVSGWQAPHLSDHIFHIDPSRHEQMINFYVTGTQTDPCRYTDMETINQAYVQYIFFLLLCFTAKCEIWYFCCHHCCRRIYRIFWVCYVLFFSEAGLIVLTPYQLVSIPEFPAFIQVFCLGKWARQTYFA